MKRLMLTVSLAMAVMMAFGAGVGFAKTETKEATYYEDELNNLCIGLPTAMLFTGNCAWESMTGEGNVGVGGGVLKDDTTGHDNVANGFLALASNTTGIGNVASGPWALRYNTEGFHNTAVGSQALESNTIGSVNTAIGAHALESNTVGFIDTAIGVGALRMNTTGHGNVASGNEALRLNTTGFDNVASGLEALRENTTGHGNVASGRQALVSNSEGSDNVASGTEALFGNTEGSFNVALGLFAGRRVSGSHNIDISNEGEEGESSTTRIGTEGKQTKAFMAGIQGTALTGCTVQVTATGQLGCNPAAGAAPASFEFSTGGMNLGNNHFVGLGSVKGNEGMVQQSVAPSGTLTKMTCFQNGTSSAAVTYTLRDNSASTTLTCTIPAGSTKGVGTGSVTFASGDLFDVRTPASGTPGKPGSFSVSTG